MFLHHVAMALLPSVLAILFFYSTLPFTANARQAADATMHQMLRALAADDGALMKRTMSDLLDDDPPRFPAWWNDAAAGTVAIGMALLSGLVPRRAKPQTIVSLWTTLVVGFCAAHLFFTFGYISWIDFWKCAGIGVLLSWILLYLRQVLPGK